MERHYTITDEQYKELLKTYVEAIKDRYSDGEYSCSYYCGVYATLRVIFPPDTLRAIREETKRQIKPI